MKDELVLQVKGLKTYFKTDDGMVKAVDDVSFDLKKGQTLGIVGESGSGKSVTNLSIMRLIPSPPGKIVGGEIYFEGKDILKMNNNELRDLRGNKISMIFQDPMTCLNPFLKVSTQLIETIRLHQGLGKKDARAKAVELLDKVGIPAAERRVENYPHQFSGGMRQRVMIAMALSCNPKVLIADEPTTALDVTIQAQILELMQKLAIDLGTSTILITHDLGVVAGMCDEVCVMYAGKIVERSSNNDIFENPKHPYTQGLIKSVPRMDDEQGEKLFSIEGQPPNLIDLPDCCPFHPRCSKVMEICKSKYPKQILLDGESRSVSCWLYKDKEE